MSKSFAINEIVEASTRALIDNYCHWMRECRGIDYSNLHVRFSRSIKKIVVRDSCFPYFLRKEQTQLLH